MGFLLSVLGLANLLLNICIVFFIARFFWRGFGAGSRLLETQPAGDAARYAMASTLLGGRGFRRAVIESRANPLLAHAPELGLAPGPIVESARKFAERTASYDWGLAGLGFLYVALFLSERGRILSPVTLLIFIVATIAAPALVLRKAWIERFTLAKPFLRENWRTTLALADERAPEQPAEEGKVLCYGGANPFTGLGQRVGGWTVSVDANRASEPGAAPAAIEVAALYDAIDDAVRRLNLKGLRADSYVFVNGAEVAQIDSLSPFSKERTVVKSPVAAMSAEETRRVLQGEDVHARGYRAFHMIGWGGEVAFTYLLRVIRVGNSLSIETIHLQMQPVAAQYREVDRIPRDGALMRALWAVETLGSTPFAVFGAAIGVVEQLVRIAKDLFGSREARELAKARRFPDYNFGYRISIRELLAAPAYHSHFQFLDAVRYRQSLDLQALNAAADYLEDKGVDTSSLKDQTRVIQNNSISVSAAGDLTLKGVAIGRGARAIWGGLRPKIGAGRTPS